MIYRLYEYSDLDVDFESEGPLGSKCGKNRECNQCIRPSMSGIPWDWCGTRVMSPRMAFRLKRLAVLAKKHPDLKCKNKPYDNKISMLMLFGSYIF